MTRAARVPRGSVLQAPSFVMSKSRRGSRHAFLRDATAEVHKNLEAVIEGRAYLRALPAYGQYLLRLHAFHLSLHHAMCLRFGDVARLWQLEAHERWLARDLADLGLEPLAPRPSNASVPLIDDLASAFGAVYVTLGSSLGARILLKRVEALGLEEGRGLSYLASLSATSDWPRFLAGLEAEPDLSERGLLRGALETFESFKDHMTRSIL